MLTLEVEVKHVIDVLDAFDVELIIFQNNTWAKVIKVIKPFLHAYDSQ
jgi:hypothetical protein